MISQQTATDIAVLYKEIEAATNLLEDVKKTLDVNKDFDIRDAFGRRVRHVELGVPTGDNSRRIFQVPPELAILVIEAVIETNKAKIAVLNERAAIEIKHPAMEVAA